MSTYYIQRAVNDIKQNLNYILICIVQHTKLHFFFNLPYLSLNFGKTKKKCNVHRKLSLTQISSKGAYNI